jgi:protein SCO1/2
MAISPRSTAVAATSVAAAFLIGVWAFTAGPGGGDRFADCRASAVSGAASVGGPFVLTDEDGRRVSDREVLAKPSLVYFGFANCPDVCPTDLARNAAAVDHLAETGHDVTPVFISVDPARDTPAVLKEWTDALHPKMIGLTGSPEELAEVARAYRTVFRVPENPEDEYYLVEHMTQTYLMLPDVGFAEFFTRQDMAEHVAKAAACFIDASAE